MILIFCVLQATCKVDKHKFVTSDQESEEVDFIKKDHFPKKKLSKNDDFASKKTIVKYTKEKNKNERDVISKYPIKLKINGNNNGEVEEKAINKKRKNKNLESSKENKVLNNKNDKRSKVVFKKEKNNKFLENNISNEIEDVDEDEEYSLSEKHSDEDLKKKSTKYRKIMGEIDKNTFKGDDNSQERYSKTRKLIKLLSAIRRYVCRKSLKKRMDF